MPFTMIALNTAISGDAVGWKVGNDLPLFNRGIIRLDHCLGLLDRLRLWLGLKGHHKCFFNPLYFSTLAVGAS